MDNYFFDSSGLIKRFRNETGSSWVIRTHRPSNKNIIHIAQISLVEVTAALTRRMNNPQLHSNYIKGIKRFERDVIGRYSIFRLTDSVVASAVLIAKNHRLRGYDAIQLSTAISIEKELLALNLSSLIFVSADNELNSAAQAEGLRIENPNNYP